MGGASILVIDGDREKLRALSASLEAEGYHVVAADSTLRRAIKKVRTRSSARGAHVARTIVSFGNYHLHLEGHTLRRGAKHVPLSANEFKLLAALARHPDQVVTATALLEEVRGSAHARKTGYLRVYMHLLRQKIEPDPTRPRYLISDAGLGYRLRTSE
ncbi:MAG: winged helix-turn-helix domain-containing protein [Polyangia bacterium]|jgi:two-component system KDP operon response regulator KdpE